MTKHTGSSQPQRIAKRRRRNPLSQRYIVRIDHKNTHGYQVRVPTSPKVLTRFFADRLHGGRRRALNAAKEWRDKTFKKHRIALDMARRVRKTNARNRSGVVGVSMQWVTKGNYQYKYYVATWCPRSNEQRHKMFSAYKYGDERARQLAAQFRKQREKELLRS